MKTARQYFNEFPEPYRTTAIKNTSHKFLDRKHKDWIVAISESFDWTTSPEGHHYWDIFTDMYMLKKQKRKYVILCVCYAVVLITGIYFLL